jgi:hypothetical protein
MRKRSTPKVDGFVLRSGYVVPFDGLDASSMVDHLKNAVLGESLQTLQRSRPVSRSINILESVL